MDQNIKKNSIAIIGMACRMPGAADTKEFWENLKNGVNSISTFSDEELLEAGVAPEILHSPQYVKSRGVIGGAAEFDAAFFGFTPRDAEVLDPQQRHFLQCAWHALEDAGYDPGKTDARIGVYGGVGTNWHLGRVDNHPEIAKYASGASVVIGNDKDYLTTRVSYKLNLRGPSVNVQSACSTSLVATVLGMNDLLDFKCDMVLAGGATIEIPEKKGYLFQEGGMESKDGKCRPFDSRANGTVFSRGVGVVLLKRLEDALRDRDHIYAVIRGGAVNNDGSNKIGYTAPSVHGQVEVAIEALESAGVDPRTIAFVEAHGTATALGDPIEVNSLTKAFRNYTSDKQFCALGSVKGNIGHTDVASGIAGLIKCAWSLKSGKLPASLHYKSANPQISFEESPFFVNTGLLDLPRNGVPLRGLLNSFGVGGTNACLILEEPPQEVSSQPEPAPAHNVLLLSARTSEALDKMGSNLRQRLETAPELEVHDVAFTCQMGRKAFAHRRSIAFTNRESLLARLSGGPGAGVADTVSQSDEGLLLFAFPGQGNQYLTMGHGLYQSYEVYRESVDRCCRILQTVIGLDLRDILFAPIDAREAAAEKLNQTYITQPALFVTSYAMAKLWMSWELKPDAMVGHSVGEYVAACLAGVFSLEDALRAVATRGKLIQDLPGGSMLAILAPEAEVLRYLPDSLEVAAVNSPKLTVIAGPTPEIAALEKTLKAKNIFHKRLATSHAFHSAMMEPALPAFAKFFQSVKLHEPTIRVASTVTGQWLTKAEATNPDYWVQHVRRAVRFTDATETILKDENRWVLLESGPGHSLESSFKAHLEASAPHIAVGSMRTEAEKTNDGEEVMGAVGRLWAAGKPIDWLKLYGGRSRRRVALPGYPFDRQTFALDFSQNHAGTKPVQKKKKPDLGDWFYLPAWKRTLEPSLVRQMNVAKDSASKQVSDSVWVVFKDRFKMGEAVIQKLGELGATVVQVEPGEAYFRKSVTEYAIRPAAKEDYESLIADLKASGLRPRRVIHLWNIDEDDEAPSLDQVERRQALSFLSTLYVQQAFINQNVLNDLRIVIGANGLFDVTGERIRRPEKALALGPCRVIAKEFQIIQSRFADLILPDSDAERGKVAMQLIEEAQLPSVETVVAYRHGHRWTETFEQLYLDPAEKGLAPALKEGGVYLITGGLGALGLLFARQIAESVKATLILNYRSNMPDRVEWDQWLATHPPEDPTSEKITAVLKLEELGATVTLAPADSADLPAMEAVVKSVRRAFGRIDGVIHAAGIAGGGIISLKTREMADAVFSAKVTGTLVLDRLFKDEAVDFIALFSSVTSYLGEIGRVDYCSGNSFMDAFAQYRNQTHPGRFVSLNWAGWNEVGMAARWEESVVEKTLGLQKLSRRQAAPCLQLVSKNGAEEIYDVLLDPEADWAIKEHVIAGVPTLVGTSFFELCYQFAEIQNAAQLPVLENLYFLAPLMFPKGQAKRVRLFAEAGEKSYRLSFKSQLAQFHPETDPWQEHFLGTVRLAAPEAAVPVDTGEWATRFPRVLNHSELIDQLTSESSGSKVQWSQRWKSNTRLTGGRGEWFATLELPGEYAGDLELYRFHPALLDMAFVAPVRDVDKGQYLPFSYRRIKLHAPVRSTSLFSHIRLAQEFKPGDDTLLFDVTLFDANGKICLEVERYGLKNMAALVAGEETGEADGDAVETPSVLSTKKRAIRPDYILPDEGKDAFSRVMTALSLPQVIISTRDMYVLLDEEFENVKKKIERRAAHREDKALVKPAHPRPALSTPYVAPENEIESAIAEIWQGVLGISQIGVNDRFTELGGNSLLAVQTVANISEAFQGELPMESFTGNSTIRTLAATVLELLVGMTNEDTLDELITALED